VKAEQLTASERAERWLQHSPTPVTKEKAQLALDVHALHLARFVTGEEPPPLVENETEATLIFTGITHWRGILNAQRALIAEYESWAEEMRRRVSLLESLVNNNPALEQWRANVLHDRRRPPLDRIAAWELTSVKCEAVGDHEHAKAARETARSLASASSGRRTSAPLTTAASTGGAWPPQ
jgi:hypothetical protein